MRDREYRRKQDQKKSYKKFVAEMNRGKIKGNRKKGSKNLNNIDFENLTEEELDDLYDDMIDEE